ncbi:hypothetical protein DLM_1782 [Aquitalea magnusonii]|uniref:Uncharacterized protein n=1 Tax=Aquitalea magnusonii TaxID=332411 RepID=A0A3G9GC08_9NEIS|nr:hypothetical protein DLM_1782 [Aquitalea magnusonii]
MIIRLTNGDESPHLLPMLEKAVRHDPTVDDVRQLLPGCKLFAVEHDGADVAAFLLRWESSECVIVAAGGSLPGVSLLDVIVPHIERNCRADFVRIHSARPGIARKLARHGYGVAEVVYRKEVWHGR